MTPEDKLLLACTRQTFGGAHQQTVRDLCRHGAIRWQVVYSTAESHDVAPLVYANLRQCPPAELYIPQNILEAFKGQVHLNIVSKERLAVRVAEALSFFNRKSIDIMMVKGVTLDVLVYDQPWYTRFNDVDLVIRPGREAIPDHEQAEIGAFFHRRGVEYDYFEHHDLVMNGVLAVDFHRIWADAGKIKFRGEDVFVMSPEDMLIAACINSCRKRFFRLKALCDIAEIVDKYRDLNWTELIRKARAYDCHNIVYTALMVTKMTVGCRAPDQALDNFAVNPVRATLIRYLAHYFNQRKSLSELYPFSGRHVFGRKVNSSLLLPYASYRWYQVGRKVKEVYNNRRLIYAS